MKTSHTLLSIRITFIKSNTKLICRNLKTFITVNQTSRQRSSACLEALNLT